MDHNNTSMTLKKTWVTLGIWLLGIIILHFLSHLLHFKISVLNMIGSNLLILGLILLINYFYTKEKIYFEWLDFKRFGWLSLFMVLYIVGANALFITVPSEISLQISWEPTFWLFYTLSTAVIPIVTFFGVLLPSMLHHWQTNHLLLKSVILSSFLYSIFQILLLNELWGGILEALYQLSANFCLGLICAFLYLRTVNIMVPIFFSFIETFIVLILSNIRPLWGNGIFNIIFFGIFALLILKSMLTSSKIAQIQQNFNIKKRD